MQTGAVRELTTTEIQKTKSWTSIFPREKKDTPKVRMITDMRPLNRCADVPKHRAERWTDVLANLENKEALWGITFDLKNWYHHLQLHPDTGRWARFKIANRGFQCTALPFGWALSPYWANKLSKPVRAWMHEQGWIFNWWVDDVLLLAPTKHEAERRATLFVEKLTTLGIAVNIRKSMNEAKQIFPYLGHHINLAENKVEHVPQKTRSTIQATKHLRKSNIFVPKFVAALAGRLLDAEK